MTTTHTQRWRDRRDSYRPAGEPIDVTRYGVALLDEAPARDFVVQHHYSASYPAARCRVGMYRAGGELVGVAVFSVPMNQRAIPKYTGQLANAGVELGRFVLLDDVPANGETWFLARAFDLLRVAKPGVKAVLSYSDPVPRKTLAGDVVTPGHVGTIYQAHNATHVGRSASRTQLLDAAGRVISPRMLSKLRNDEQGAAYAYQSLRDRGAPPRLALESGRDYVARVSAAGSFRKERHPGNLAYAWGLDKRAKRQLPAGLRYPKACEEITGHYMPVEDLEEIEDLTAFAQLAA
jgi:hypothetical protein